MLSPRPGLGLEAQKTGFGLGLMTVVAAESSSLASWPRNFLKSDMPIFRAIILIKDFGIRLKLTIT